MAWVKLLWFLAAQIPAMVFWLLRVVTRVVYRGDAQRTVAFLFLGAFVLVVVMVEWA